MRKPSLAALLTTMMVVSMLATTALAVEMEITGTSKDFPVTVCSENSSKSYQEITDDDALVVISKDADGEIQVHQNNDVDPRIPGWPNWLYVYAHNDGNDNWSVWAKNIGLDWIDKVTLNVRVYNERGLQHSLNYSEEGIIQAFPRRMAEGYTRGWTRIEVRNIRGFDEGDYGTIPDVNLYR